jgi:Maltose operon periplasmic protein precursor (MalM).
VVHNQVFAPNVLVLDENLQPAAWFPSRFFSYQQPGVMSADRLEGVMKLTPVPGQQKIYLLVFTTDQDLTQTTRCWIRPKLMPKAPAMRYRIFPIRWRVTVATAKSN